MVISHLLTGMILQVELQSVSLLLISCPPPPKKQQVAWFGWSLWMLLIMAYIYGVSHYMPSLGKVDGKFMNAWVQKQLE